MMTGAVKEISIKSILRYFFWSKHAGDYWIDPNQGDTKDSILVYCEMERRATCVRPSPGKTKQVTYQGKPRAEVWFSEMDSGFQVPNQRGNRH